MDLKSLVAGVSDFDSWTHGDKIKLFAWHLHAHKGRERFKAADVGKCYEEIVAAPPANIGSFLNAMADRKPPQALKSAAGYVLERRVHEDFDKRFGQRPATVYVEALLTDLPNRIPSADEKGYLEEALTCLRHSCFRAAIVMAWNLAYDHLCELVLARHLPDFNAKLPKSYPKADILAIKDREDFELLKESQVLQVCKSANIISPNEHKVAKEKLDRRNLSAHPSSQVPLQQTAEEFIRDLIENFMLKQA